MPRDAAHGQKLKSLIIEKRGTKRRRKQTSELKDTQAPQGLDSSNARLLAKEECAGAKRLKSPPNPVM